jgi:hypothetical protein
MLSILELCHVIESAFLPLACKCQVEPAGLLEVQISDAETGQMELLVTGIAVNALTGSQDLCKLINDIQEELKLTHEARSWPRERASE